MACGETRDHAAKQYFALHGFQGSSTIANVSLHEIDYKGFKYVHSLQTPLLIIHTRLLSPPDNRKSILATPILHAAMPFSWG
jgi:hypothetical protein